MGLKQGRGIIGAHPNNPKPMNMIAAHHKLQNEIVLLESMSKQGAPYSDAQGRYGWRNPIRADTGPLLAARVALQSPRRMLEVGTAHGLSALHLMSGVDWSQGGVQLDTIEFQEEVAREAQQRFVNLELPVHVFCGEAMEVIRNRLSGPYDLVFLDAQKSHYGMQLRALMDLGLLSPRCLLLVDNVIDRKAECSDLMETLQIRGIQHRILPTECGLLEAWLP